MKKIFFFTLLISLFVCWFYYSSSLKNMDEKVTIELIKEVTKEKHNTHGKQMVSSKTVLSLHTEKNTYNIEEMEIYEELKLNEWKQCEIKTIGRITPFLLFLKKVIAVWKCN